MIRCVYVCIHLIPFCICVYFMQERNKLEQPANLLQKPSSEANEDAFHSLESNSPKSSPKVPRSDAVEQHKRMHQQSVETLVGLLKNRDHGSAEDSIPRDWVYVLEEVGIDHQQSKTTESKLKEVVDQLKEQLCKQSDEIQRQQKEIAKLKGKLERGGEEKQAFKLKILKETESDKATMSAENARLKGLIHELETNISEKGAHCQMEQLLTQQSKPKDLLQLTAPDVQPHSLGEASTGGEVPTIKKQPSYDTAVSIQVSPSELTESVLHLSLERQSMQQNTQTQTEERTTPVQQDFTFATIENLRKQLGEAWKEAERLQHEKDAALHERESNSEVETLRRDLEDARMTICNLQVCTQLFCVCMTMQVHNIMYVHMCICFMYCMYICAHDIMEYGSTP